MFRWNLKRSKYQQLYCLILQVDVLWCHCKVRASVLIKIILIVCLYFREQENFISLSFETISGVGSNGAVIHYRYVTWSKVLKSSSYRLEGSMYGKAKLSLNMHNAKKVCPQEQES